MHAAVSTRGRGVKRSSLQRPNVITPGGDRRGVTWGPLMAETLRFSTEQETVGDDGMEVGRRLRAGGEVADDVFGTGVFASGQPPIY